MKKIADIAAHLFIVFVVVLTGISLLGVWNILAGDVITKSIATVALMAFVSVVVVGASRFIDRGEDEEKHTVAEGDPNIGIARESSIQAFAAIRHTAIGFVFVAVGLFALIGVLAIWDVLTGAVVDKLLATGGIVAVASFIIIMVCFEREGKFHNTKMSVGRVVAGIFLGLFLLWLLVALFSLFLF